ncbi:MAG: hypothetical protein KKE20_07025, partial [Nanoarchaeota archaeon]|nr:hypothetical protein [Nanoarchaeota archaeon]
PRVVYLIFFSSVTYLALNPVFTMKRIGMNTISGVDILTNSLGLENLAMITSITAAAGIIALLFTFSHPLRRGIKFAMFTCLGAFFGYYITIFSTDIILFYLRSIVNGVPEFVKFYFAIFLIATALFYSAGGLYFIYISLYRLHKREV